jgi:hypothetical protein
MKKMVSRLCKWVLYAWLIVYNPAFSIAQLISSHTYKAQVKEIVISISGVDYHDRDFHILRETLQKNAKAQFKKQTYSDGTAKIHLVYNGTAASLWNQLPAYVKQPFKLLSIDAYKVNLKKNKAEQ